MVVWRGLARDGGCKRRLPAGKGPTRGSSLRTRVRRAVDEEEDPVRRGSASKGLLTRGARGHPPAQQGRWVRVARSEAGDEEPGVVCDCDVRRKRHGPYGRRGRRT